MQEKKSSNTIRISLMLTAAVIAVLFAVYAIKLYIEPDKKVTDGPLIDTYISDENKIIVLEKNSETSCFKSCIDSAKKSCEELLKKDYGLKKSDKCFTEKYQSCVYEKKCNK